jgi:hypothetical protein
LNLIVRIHTVELHLSGLIRTERQPDLQKIRIIGFIFENRLQWSIKEKKKFYNRLFRLHIYLLTNKTLVP